MQLILQDFVSSFLVTMSMNSVMRPLTRKALTKRFIKDSCCSLRLSLQTDATDISLEIDSYLANKEPAWSCLPSKQIIRIKFKGIRQGLLPLDCRLLPIPSEVILYDFLGTNRAVTPTHSTTSTASTPSLGHLLEQHTEQYSGRTLIRPFHF